MVFRPSFYSLPLLCVVRWFSGKNRSLEKRSGFEFTGVTNWLWDACARDFLLSEAQVPHPHLLNGYNYWSRSNSVLPKIHVNLEPQNVALFGNRVFANIVSQDEVVLDPMTGVLMRGKDTQRHTQRRTPCEDTDRNWNDSSTSQEHQGLLAATRSKEKGMKWILPHSPQEEPTLPSLISNIWPPESGENTFLLV